MEKIPTADEIIDKYNNEFEKTGNPYWLRKPMIEFAKLHVEAALKEASENAKINEYISFGWRKIDKDSILNSYPLDKIK